MTSFKIDEHKMMYHIDRVNEWLHGDKASVFPIYVEVSPVGFCNHRCTFCALDYLGYANTRLDTDHLKMSIMSMALHGVKSIMYAGEGEPLLHSDIAELISWTVKSGIDVALTTNAAALTPKLSEQILKHCTWIKISCNAGDAVTYAEVHGCNYDHWDKLWRNIEYAVWAKREYDLKTTIGVQAVLLPENAETLNKLAKRCRSAGVDYLTIKPYSQHNDSKNKQYADIMYEQTYDKYLDALSMYASSRFEIITRRKSMNSWDIGARGYSKCLSVPYFWAYIMATGDVYGCSAFLGDQRFCYGNIDTDPFHKVWQGSRRKKAIKFMQDELNIDDCRRNCRMHKINNFLWEVSNPGEHMNFI